jgi:site-specific recombinase XerD
MGIAEVEQFLTHLAVNGQLSASTQNQAKCTLLFLYKEALAVELPWLDNVEQTKTTKRLPVVLNRDEIQAILLRLTGTQWLIVSLLYGTVMQIMEGLRMQDIDVKLREILLRDGKGFKGRVTMLPMSSGANLLNVRELYENDLAQGYGTVTSIGVGRNKTAQV